MMGHMVFYVPSGADTPVWWWLMGFLGFPIMSQSFFYWWFLKESAKEDRFRILKQDGKASEE